ncbi:head-tail adaptor protein [Methylobacterium oryzihabitans]|uniref:Head-tail adaptor protein n=1 Tax=Methylobacterium oryzihabitans TaxID=2499852 RepID=A0A3S2W9Z0_9HYPH|nr:head-tail adaptor protein [Methylobacterium oryzihabitans]RVU17497.1 head-tail adaptor protein [Methylobacterium oryzihabitans]
MDPGQFDRRVTVRQRPGEGRSRGAYADAFTVWACYRPESAREAVQGGRAQTVESGTLVVRDSARMRTVSSADRVVLGGRDFAIEGVGLPDRRTGLVTLKIATTLGGQ